MERDARKVVRLRRQDVTVRGIAEQLNVPKSFVQKVLKEWGQARAARAVTSSRETVGNPTADEEAPRSDLAERLEGTMHPEYECCDPVDCDFGPHVECADDIPLLDCLQLYRTKRLPHDHVAYQALSEALASGWVPPERPLRYTF
jgi:hypothetical protein